MATQNFLIMNLLRLITPEEIGDIATKHNGGKFLSLTDLVNERVEQNIYRDFSSPDAIDEIHESHAQAAQAKILPFKKKAIVPELETTPGESGEPASADSSMDISEDDPKVSVQEISESIEDDKEALAEHAENENMSSFIMIEKARLKRSQQVLKQKEIIDLYQKNSDVDVEQIKGSNKNADQSKENGVLINKRHY